MPVPDPSDASAMAVDVADLTALPELDEAAILAALETRFARRAVYTNTGAILLAVNPFEKLQGLYDRAALGEYLQSFETRASSIRAGTKRLPPHIYQVAGEAFRAMVRGGGDQETRPDQAILVSGESGSGKTESTKFLLEYLAQAGDAAPAALAQTLRSQRGIAAKVLQTNILLESFGNARTLRNDNSSRFGKFIKLHFTPGGRLTGASIQTYLLEKVRLVSQSHGERNYHVFYEMSLGASAAARQRWMLDPPPGSVANDSPMAAGEDASTDMAGQFRHYRYLNQSGCFVRRDGVADVAMFRRVMDAMEVVGFTPFERAGVFDLLAALMHIGNLAFQHDEGSDRLGFSQSGSSSSRTDLMPSCLWSRDAAAKLLAVDARELERALSVRRIRAGTDFVSVKLSAEQANNARDALAKALYGRLFEWMVSRMNEFLKMDADALRGGRSHFIGILDIFGFEVFPTNSFEQLCINYANETLQQQFNEYVFKLEQREYEAQGVEWKYVAFLDNQDCVQLIAQRPTGLLSLIDEECVMPKGSDATLASKLYRACDGHARFQASRIQKARGQFTVVHYAGPVEYSSAGFLDKNKDVLHQEAVDLLAFSTRDGSFTRTLCEALSTPAAARARAKSSPRQRAQTSKHRGASVGLQFKEQLTTLLETLERTRPHYVRCLKPNDQCEARAFDRARVLDQLRCSGVMEAVRVSRAGYPVRLPLDLFVGRYWPLQRGAATHPLRQLKADPAAAIDPAAAASTHARALLRELLPKLPRDPVVTQQTRQTAHEPQGEFAQQCVAVGVQVGHTKLFLKKASHEALEELRAQRLHGHMLRIARAMVGFAARARFLRVRRAVVAVQRRFRTKRCGRQGRAARIVQRAMRGAAQRRKYRRVLLAVRVVQCRFRWRAHRRRVLQERERERERQRRQREAEDAKRRQLAAKQRERQRELEAQQRALQLQVPPPAPIDTGSGTASDSSSSPAKSELSPTSQTSNDVEGSASSGYSSDEYYGGGGGAGHKGFGGGLTPVDEGMAAVGRASRRFPNGRRPSTIDTLGPLAASTPRRSRARPPFGQGPHGQSQPQLIGHGGHSLARKSSFRSTRSSRAVALPRLDVVQETQWVNDEDRFSCHICNKRFSMFKRKHHCRACGEVICNSCSLYHRIQSRSMRVCVSCVAFHSLESPTHAAALASAASSARSGSGASSRKISNGSSQPTTDRARSSTQSSGLWLNAWPEPPYPEDEEERLTVLRELNVRELAGSGRFNMYCEVAAKTMKCPIAYVSIIDEEEQLLVANIGMAHATLPRELSFCAHTICQPSVLVVLDTKLDERFRDNPMVKGDKGAVKIRYYAGATIFSKDGHALGTVAVLDTKPRREADQEHIGMLQHLSFLASEKMAQSAAHEDSDSEYL